MNFISQDFIYLVAFITSFLVTFLVIPWLIPRLESRNIVGTDMNKITKPKIPEIGENRKEEKGRRAGLQLYWYM